MKSNCDYGRYGVKNTPFYESEHERTHRRIPGFFSKFDTLEDFRTQIKRPMVMPLVRLTAALTEVIDLIENTGLALINLLVLDFTNTELFLGNVRNDISVIGYHLYRCVFDTLWETAALLSRTVATIVSSGFAAVNFAQDMFPSNAEQKPQEISVLHDETDSAYASSM